MTHPATDVVGFGRALRAAGLGVGTDQLVAFARALPLVDATERRAVYLAARATLVTRREDLDVFDAEFARWFGGAVPGKRSRPAYAPPRPDPSRIATALGAFMATRAAPSDPDAGFPDEVKAASQIGRAHV